MAGERTRNVRARLVTEHDDRGFKSARESAAVLERELRRVEEAERRQAQMVMRAQAEMAADHDRAARLIQEAEAKKAAALVEANRKQGEAMTAFGRVVLTGSAAIAVGLGLTAKAAIDWESAWAGVTKTVDGTPQQMQVLEDQLRSLARSLPATHEEIAGVAEAAGQLGVQRQYVAEFTKTMIDLGETTNLSADEAATALAQLGNIMGTTPDDVDRVGAALVALGNAGASTEQDIVSMALRIAGAGRQANMSTSDVLGIASALSSVGIEAEAGGSAISRVITNINSDVMSGKGNLETFARVAGMPAQKFREAWEKDAAGALTSFIEGLGRMQASGEDVNVVLGELGLTDIRVADALRRSASAGELLRESITLGSEAFAENNALVEEANKRYATTEARLEMARNQINDAAIDIGGNFLPAIASAAEWVGSLSAAFGALTPTQQSWVAGLGAAAAGIGTLVGGAAVVIPKLQELKATIDNLHGGSSAFGKALGGVTSFLTGPWGLALGGAAILATLWASEQGKAAQRTEELTRTLDENTGAFTENTAAKVASNLQDAGALDAARTLGIALDDVTSALLGQEDARRRVEGAIERVRENEQAAATDTSLYTAELVKQGDAASLLERQMGVQADSLEAAQGASENLREATGKTSDAMSDAEENVVALSEGLDGGTASGEAAKEAIDALTQALEDLNGPALSANEAEIRFQEAIDAVTASVTENGQTLDLNTEAGRKNQSTLNDLARASAERANAVLNQTGSESAFRAELERGRQALYESARQTGMSEEAAWQYVDSVLAIPAAKTTDVEFRSSAAEQRAAAFRDILSRIPNSIVVTADLRATNPFYANRANGAVVDYFANGGIRNEHHVAEIAPAGQTRIWNEPETEGEAYIPLATSKRSRSVAILEDVAERFGMYVGRRFADGGFWGGGSSMPAPIGGVTFMGPVYGAGDPEALARATVRKQRDAAAAYNMRGIARTGGA